MQYETKPPKISRSEITGILNNLKDRELKNQFIYKYQEQQRKETMSKFKYEILAGEEGTVVAFNKEKYTKEQALELGKKELISVVSDWKYEKFIVFESHVHFGFGRDFDSNFINSWWIADLFEPSPKKNKNYVPVWVVRVEDGGPYFRYGQ